MNPIYQAISSGAKTYEELQEGFASREYLDALIRQARKSQSILLDGAGRFFRAQKQREDGDTKPCRTCFQERDLDLYAKYSSTCSVCVESGKKQRAAKRKARLDLYKQGLKTCNTCGDDHYLFRFKKFTSGNRSKDCQDCLMARKRRNSQPKVGAT